MRHNLKSIIKAAVRFAINMLTAKVRLFLDAAGVFFVFANTEFKWDINSTFFHIYNKNYLSPVPVYFIYGVGMELFQLCISLGWVDVSGSSLLSFVFKNSLYSGVFAMVGGLILVPLVSLVTQKTKPKDVDAMFECYNATKTVEITESLGD